MTNTGTSFSETAPAHFKRRLPIGAEVQPGRGVHFRVWAPRRTQADVLFSNRSLDRLQLTRDGDGYFAGFCPDAGVGDEYCFCFEHAETRYPDPASRFQPDGPHGPSRVIDPAAFSWNDQNWKGLSPDKQVIYELHIGTFTPAGTWGGAEKELAELAALGVTCIEVMPCL